MGFFIQLNICMASLYNAPLKPLGSSPTHPYDHATKLFLADTYRLAPKQVFLYYVCININTSLLGGLSSLLAPPGTASTQSITDQLTNGLLAKRVDLPQFTMLHKVMNAYNRKHVIQTKLEYNPITISFHDDAGDVITNFWNDYYTYYYRDSDYGESSYGVPTLYQSRQNEEWGFTPRMQTLTPFLKSIQIFSLHNKRFTEYEVINPIITGWKHGSHDSSNGTGLMESNMTVVYETVKYKTGYINVNDMPGFGTINYDNFQSPIDTGKTNIYTGQGILGALGGQTTDLARPDGTTDGGNLTGSLLNTYKTIQNFSKINLTSVLNSAITQVGTGVANGAINSALNSIFVPTLSGTPGYGGTAASSAVALAGSAVGASIYNGFSASPAASPFSSGIATILNNPVGSVVGGATNWISSAINNQLGLAQNPNNPTGTAANPGSTAIYQVQSTNGVISISATTGQPVAGATTTTYLDADGNVTGKGTSASNGIPSQTLVAQQSLTDSNGISVTKNIYADGSSTVVDSEGIVQQTTPAGASGAIQVNTVSNQVSSTAQISNAISGTVSTGVGGFVGLELNTLLKSTGLGNSVLGQTVATGISGVAGMVTAKITNNVLQPIVNNITGQVSQMFNNSTKSIQNVLSSFTTTGASIGGYDPSNPMSNLVSTAYNPDGSSNFMYADGTKVNIDANGYPVGAPEVPVQDPSITQQVSNFFNPGGSAGAVPAGYGNSNNFDNSIVSEDYQTPDISYTPLEDNNYLNDSYVNS